MKVVNMATLSLDIFGEWRSLILKTNELNISKMSEQKTWD
jgi:hypothetical protein